MEHELLQVHSRCLASDRQRSLLDGNAPHRPPTLHPGMLRTAVASAPFLVCVGSREPGVDAERAWPHPLPCPGPSALRTQPRWRARVGAGRLWARAGKPARGQG